MAYINRNDAIKTIKTNLKARTGRSWSVTGGSGTAYGWITIQSLPRERGGQFGYMSEGDCKALADALGLDRPCHFQGQNIPAGSDYYEEYIDRSAGKTPATYGKQYWD